MSETPTCFFLNPSFQSAYIGASLLQQLCVESVDLCTFATLVLRPAPPAFFAGATFLPAFLDGACYALAVCANDKTHVLTMFSTMSSNIVNNKHQVDEDMMQAASFLNQMQRCAAIRDKAHLMAKYYIPKAQQCHFLEFNLLKPNSAGPDISI
jgi:hypothetical protein